MPPLTITRPPTEEERTVLSAPLGKHFGWSSGVVSALCVLAVAFLLLLLAAGFLDVPPWWAVPAAVGAGLLVAMRWYARVQLREHRELAKRASAQTTEVAAGHVLSTTYDARDAIRVEQSEDEGLSFYLLLDDGRTLFLSGQYLDDVVDQDFPWRRFEVVRAPIGRWVVAVKPLGDPLRPSHTRSPFTLEELNASPEDGALLTADFQAIKDAAR